MSSKMCFIQKGEREKRGIFLISRNSDRKNESAKESISSSVRRVHHRRRRITAENNSFPRVPVWMVIALLVSSIHHCAIARTYTPFFFFFSPRTNGTTWKWRWHFYSRGRRGPLLFPARVLKRESQLELWHWPRLDFRVAATAQCLSPPSLSPQPDLEPFLLPMQLPPALLWQFVTLPLRGVEAWKIGDAGILLVVTFFFVKIEIWIQHFLANNGQAFSSFLSFFVFFCNANRSKIRMFELTGQVIAIVEKLVSRLFLVHFFFCR